MSRYNPAVIEPKWQAYWEKNKTFATPELPTGKAGKLYSLDMFPYPSGDGLHVGHPEGYTASDIVCRAARAQGKSVLHPMGFDSFGLPAEEHAIKTGTHPRVQTESNIATFRRQLKMLGFSFDWDREIATTDIEYIRWTQWIFLQLHDTWFDEAKQKGRPISELPIPKKIEAEGEAAVALYRDEHRLAYQSEAPVNWCQALGTVLANEEVIDGKSERGGHPVVRIPLRQWMLRITAYAERLENDLEGLDWAESIKSLQRNWIGRSVGAEVDFYIGPPVDSGDASDSSQAKAAAPETGTPQADAFETYLAAVKKSGFPRKPSDEVLRVYTTRPDTLFGATYMVIAPEHPFVSRLSTPEQADAVRTYCEQASMKSDLDRTDLAKEKTGVFTGSYALNPVNSKPIPIWVADYVLISYGTGAIMAVPAHDDRDFEFAQQFDIDIIAVVDPGDAVDAAERAEVLAGKRCSTITGTAINSEAYNGLSTDEFKTKIASDLAAKGVGKSAVNYKLRDWLFSRQRFWGEPFPILHELDSEGNKTGIVRAVEASDLPVDLPHLDDFKPHGRPEPPLDKAPDEWLYPVIDGKRYKRETNTMPQWAGSCWYYLRFIDPTNAEAPVDKEKEAAWMPVDLYIGGAEHAVLHLLYARFWHKVLFDRGVVSTTEPFQKLVNQGMILGDVEFTGYKTASGDWVSADLVQASDEGPIHKKTGESLSPVSLDAKLTKKKGEGFVLREDAAIKIDSRAYKMSKSRGNVINPDTVVSEYGADALRLYEMFMGPLEATKPWSMDGVNGVYGFLGRVWRLIIDDRAEATVLSPAVTEKTPSEEELRELHKTIQKVTHDIDALAFNTAISRMMEFTNFFTKRKERPKAILQPFVQLLAPFAPHIAEELWQALGNESSLTYAPWPICDESLLQEKSVQVVVQVNGKVRGKIKLPADVDKETMIEAAKSNEKVAGHLSGKEIVKTIAIPGKLVNFVVKG